MTTTPQLQIAALLDLDRDDLVCWWERFHDHKPPRNASRGFLRRRLAYRIQEMRHGGLKPAIRRTLDRIASGTTLPVSSDQNRTPIKPGTRLLRTWQGKAYEVSVAEDGFVFEGERYRSLSAVARAYHWLDLLIKGKIATIRELANIERARERYVTQQLRLAFLAPDIVDAILEGRQPPALTAGQLIRSNLPLEWGDQRRLLGFAT